MTIGAGFRVWYRALRPFTYSASLVPVLVGSAIAWSEGHVNLALFLAALLGSALIQMGTNLANEYFDYVQGVDKIDSLGPAGVIVQGKLPASHVLIAAILAFTTGAILGIYIAMQVGIIILLVGLLSVLFAWFYTAKPFSLGYRGLGEPEVFVFMGPIMVVAAYYVQARTFAWPPLLISIPVGVFVTAILHANNLRDIEQDMERGRLTWAVLACRFWGSERGRRIACWGYYLMLIVPYLILISLCAIAIVPWFALLTLVTVPQAFLLVRFVSSGVRGKPLSRAVRGTSLLHLTFGVTLAIGYLLGWLLL
jgi:1,4-dihydroxy-2-naphthoate octaprenyltransferase